MPTQKGKRKGVGGGEKKEKQNDGRSEKKRVKGQTRKHVWGGSAEIVGQWTLIIRTGKKEPIKQITGWQKIKGK